MYPVGTIVYNSKMLNTFTRSLNLLFYDSGFVSPLIDKFYVTHKCWLCLFEQDKQ